MDIVTEVFHRILLVQSTSTEGGVLSHVQYLKNFLSLFFCQATLIIAFCRGLGLAGHYLRQPRVIFEILGGILLGPSAVGRDANYMKMVFPTTSISYLSLVANIGLTFYLFLVGMELDPRLLKSHMKKAGGIAIIGMAVPFAIGVGVSRYMFDALQGDDPKYEDVPFHSFFTFIGTAFSITAFPVLARLLKEGGLIYTRAGSITMSAAALNDGIAWCLLTLAISIAQAGTLSIAGYVFLMMFALMIILYFVIKPVLERLTAYVEAQHNPIMNNNLFALTLCLVMMTAWVTELIGLDFIFGGFVFGLIMPRGSHLFKECNEKLEDFILTYTLPLYFTLSGIKTDVTQINTGKEWAVCVVICLCATAGKVLGAGSAAYFSGLPIRETGAIAFLMNTRGLVELIVLNLGLNAGILSTKTFSVMVIMCLFTTFLTTPMVNLIYPKSIRLQAMHEEMDAKAAQEEMALNNESLFHGKHAHSLFLKEGGLHTRIGIVVDTLPQMTSLVNLLAFFTPHTVNSSLAITAMHFIEPTETSADEFLALNEDGRLIRIDEEPTDLSLALAEMHDPAAKKPELLPLTMFCKAMHSAVNAFRVQGNPEEFPLVMRNLVRENDISLQLVPWRRDSFYLQKLFWSTVHTMHNIPLGLIVDLSNVAGQVGMGSGDQHGQHGQGGQHRSLRRESSNRGGNMNQHGGLIRARGNSLFYHDANAAASFAGSSSLVGDIELGTIYTGNNANNTSSGIIPGSAPSPTAAASGQAAAASASSPRLYTNQQEFAPTNRRPSISSSIMKLDCAGITSQIILVIMTGQTMDVHVCALVKRLMEHSLHQIFVLLPKDLQAATQSPAAQSAAAEAVKASSDSAEAVNNSGSGSGGNSGSNSNGSFVLEAIEILKKESLAKENVSMIHIDVISTDIEGIFLEVLDHYPVYDLLLSSFVEPTAARDGRYDVIGGVGDSTVPFSATGHAAAGRDAARRDSDDHGDVSKEDVADQEVAHHHAAASATINRRRADTFAHQLADVFSGGANNHANADNNNNGLAVPDIIESRLHARMPTRIAFSQLTYPELGVLGSKLYEYEQQQQMFTSKHKKMLLILHETERGHYLSRHPNATSQSIYDASTARRASHNSDETANNSNVGDLPMNLLPTASSTHGLADMVYTTVPSDHGATSRAVRDSLEA